jgi:hypothetical protein
MDAFAPATDAAPDASSVFVPVSWALAGFAVAVTGGFGAALAGAPTWVPPVAAGAGLVGGAVLGTALGRWERWSALNRPALVDASGRTRRPVHPWVHLLPIAVGTTALAVLGALLGTATRSFGPPLVCTALVLGGTVLARQLVAEHQLARALERAEAGELLAGRAQLGALAQARWAPRAIRGIARANLGMLALSAGDLVEAARWFAGVERGQAGAWARTGRSLLAVLDGDVVAAEALVSEVLTGPFARSIGPQADAVRLLLVLRRDGEGTALRLGEQLLRPDATALFRGLLGELRLRAGQPVDDGLLSPTTLAQLRAMGVASKLPELSRVLSLRG